MSRSIDEIKQKIELYSSLINENHNEWSNEFQRICHRWMSAGASYDQAKGYAEDGTRHINDRNIDYTRKLERLRTELKVKQRELEEIRNPEIKYQRLLIQKMQADSESDLRHLAILFCGMNRYKDSEQLADECNKRADTIEEEQKRIAEKERRERLERERIAEIERKERERIAEIERKEQERIEEVRRLERERIAEEERLERERIAEIKRIEKPFWQEFYNLEHARRKYEDRKFWIEQRILWKEQGACVICGGKLSFFRRKCTREKNTFISKIHQYYSFDPISLAELDERITDISNKAIQLFNLLDKSSLCELKENMMIRSGLYRIEEESERKFKLIEYENMSPIERPTFCYNRYDEDLKYHLNPDFHS